MQWLMCRGWGLTISPIYFYFLAKIEINFQFCAKFSDKLGCYWKYIDAARFFKFLKFVLKLQSSDWFGPFTQKINDKTLKRKIQFSNDKDMKRVFLLPSVINFQELNPSKSTKLKMEAKVTVNSDLY